MIDIAILKPNTIIGQEHEGCIRLPAWIGFQSRLGLYGSVDKESLSDGTVRTNTRGASVDGNYILSQEQRNAIQYLSANSEQVRDSLLMALLDRHEEAREIYEEALPNISTITDYKSVVAPAFIHIMNSHRDGYAYYGFEMGCTWDEEHGFGAMMHKDRVVDFGQAENSFNPWSTYRDNGTAEAKRLEYKNSHKKWWAFWK